MTKRPGAIAVIITLIVGALAVLALTSIKWEGLTLVAIGGGVLLLILMVVGHRASIKQAEFTSPEDESD